MSEDLLGNGTPSMGRLAKGLYWLTVGFAVLFLALALAVLVSWDLRPPTRVSAFDFGVSPVGWVAIYLTMAIGSWLASRVFRRLLSRRRQAN